MAAWSYEAFETAGSGRDGITELERRVTEQLERLGPRAEHAKTVMTNVIGGMARAVVYFPDTPVAFCPAAKVAGWIKADVNTLADSSDTERCKEEMFQSIADLLSSLPDAQAARSKIAATACRNGYATVTLWYPADIS